jgi:hypothetical protein
MHKIEDAVLCRLKPGNETGPGNRTLGWCGRAEPAEMPLIANSCEVRQRAPVALYERRIHPVHPEHNQFGNLTSPMRKAAGNERNAQYDRGRSHEIEGKGGAAASYWDDPPRYPRPSSRSSICGLSCDCPAWLIILLSLF